MINLQNIKIFDYIFSIGCGYKYYMLDESESYYLESLNSEIKNISELSDFGNKYSSCMSGKSF